MSSDIWAAGRPGQWIDLGGRTVGRRAPLVLGAGTRVTNGRVVALTPTASPVIDLTTPDAVLDGVTIDAGGHSQVVGVRVSSGASCNRLDRLRFVDTWRGIEAVGTEASPIVDLHVFGCRYTHSNPTNLTSQNAVYAEDTYGLVLQDFHAEDTYSDALAIRARCAGIRILRGRALRPGRASPNNGNGIDGNSGLVDAVIDGFEVVGAHGSGIVVEDGPFAASNGSHCRNVEIRGCTVRDGVAPSGGKAHGIEVVLKAGGVQLPHDVRVIGGLSEGCEGSGMFVIGRLVQVHCHTSRGNREYGFHVANGAFDVSFTGCLAVGNGDDGTGNPTSGAAWSGFYSNGGVRVMTFGCHSVGKDAVDGIEVDGDLDALTQTQRYAQRFDASQGVFGPSGYGHSDAARPVRNDSEDMVGILSGNRSALFEDGPGSIYQTTNADAGATPGDLRVRDGSGWTSVTKT